MKMSARGKTNMNFKKKYNEGYLIHEEESRRIEILGENKCKPKELRLIQESDGGK
jgi:hypothetical protein